MCILMEILSDALRYRDHSMRISSQVRTEAVTHFPGWKERRGEKERRYFDHEAIGAETEPKAS